MILDGTGRESHPAADLFPLMAEAELASLAEDIKANGQQHPITLHEGKVLDGRNRVMACERAGVLPRFEQFEVHGDISPVDFVLAQNLHRKHLAPSQRAFLVVEAAKQLEGEARKRMLAVQNNLAAKEIREAASANLREHVEGKAITLAAAPLQVSPRTAESAKRIERLGAPELLEVTKAGHVSIGAASEVAVLPHEEQRRLVAQGRKAVAAKARELREAKRARQADGDLERPVRPATQLPAEIIRFDKPASASAREALLERFVRCVRHVRDEAERLDEFVVELGYLLEDLDRNTDGFMKTVEDEIAQRATDLEDESAEGEASDGGGLTGAAAINGES